MFAASLLFIALAPACNDPVSALEGASLSVRYVSPEGTCSPEGVVDVEARLDGVVVGRSACADGVVRADEIEPGDHTLELVGLDASGVVSHRVSDVVTLRPQTVTHVGPVRLVLAPGSVSVAWSADALGCAERDLDVVLLTEGGHELGAARVACSSERASFEDVPPGDYLVWAFVDELDVYARVTLDRAQRADVVLDVPSE